MKNIYLLTFLTLSLSVFGQETEFKFSEDGFTDYVVIECVGKTQTELYKKTIEWISVTFNTPKEVIKGQIENDYIRIEGSSKSLICLNVFGTKKYNNAIYQIEISFKPEKYKFDVIEIKQFGEPSKYSSGGWYPVQIINIGDYYKKGKIKSGFKYFPEFIPKYFNNLNLELKEFLLSDKIPSKKEDW
jgi:hypothetical protein